MTTRYLSTVDSASTDVTIHRVVTSLLKTTAAYLTHQTIATIRRLDTAITTIVTVGSVLSVSRSRSRVSSQRCKQYNAPTPVFSYFLPSLWHSREPRESQEGAQGAQELSGYRLRATYHHHNPIIIPSLAYTGYTGHMRAASLGGMRHEPSGNLGSAAARWMKRTELQSYV
jgi:hypothetical protein